MKNVAIITITNSGLNFGNRLQNYALQERLKQYGVYPETIYSSNVCKNSLLLSKLRRKVKKILKGSRRSRFFDEFDKNHLTIAKTIHYGKLNESVFSEGYVAYIVGSDQVWNPNFHFNSEFEFMTFAEKKKRYSYAGSFGVMHIPDAFIENYKLWLKQMRRISVREESGRILVKELTGIDAYVHVDPTMLLTNDEYIKIEEKPPKELPKRYLLIYYLGEKSEEFRAYIKQMADKEQLEIIELSESPYTSFYHIGPQHFLYIFRHAEYVCTDSFHGTVFSILFKKRFTVFSRQDKDIPMNSRIDTLLNKLHLSDRWFGILTIEGSQEPIDYEDVGNYLEKERQSSENYFREISLLW